jgi:hypothetical protein
VSLEPYYDHGGVTIYHADCRDVLPHIGPVDAVLTDPVWVNGMKRLPGSDDPEKLLTEALYRVDAKRVVIHLGCLTDPRMLMAVPKKWPFFRVCWLRFPIPSYRGRALTGSDVAYVFGEPPLSRKGNVVIGGECHADHARMMTEKERLKRFGHPTPRNLAHVRWLVWKLSNEGETVVDPFAGERYYARCVQRAGPQGHRDRSIGAQL